MRGRRRRSLAVGLGALAIVVAAPLLPPSPRGWGTHECLYLPPCTFRLLTGQPCATCGLTTSCCHVARGEIARAFASNPAGLLVYPLAAVLAALGLLGAALDRDLLRPFAWIVGPRGWLLLLPLFAALWAWQIAARAPP